MKHPLSLSLASRLLLGAMLALAVLGAPWNAPKVARAAGNFVVNSSADTVSTDSYLTLREAIRVANGDLTGPFTAPERAQLVPCLINNPTVAVLENACFQALFERS